MWNRGGVKHGEAGADKRRGSWDEVALSRVMPVKQGYTGLWSWPRWASAIGPNWIGKLLCAGKKVGQAGRKGGGSGPARESAQERFRKILKFNLFPGLNHIHTQLEFERILLEP
jgi:hypothetical protein